jgi:hypothetical protein
MVNSVPKTKTHEKCHSCLIGLFLMLNLKNTAKLFCILKNSFVCEPKITSGMHKSEGIFLLAKVTNSAFHPTFMSS